MKRNRKAQVVLDTALVLVALTLFMVGIIRIWAWFGRQYVDRWHAYEGNRVRAGQVTTYLNGGGMVGIGYEREPLNLFE